MGLIVASTERIRSRSIPPGLDGPGGKQHVIDTDASTAALCTTTGLYPFPHLPYSPDLPRNRFWCNVCREKADALYAP